MRTILIIVVFALVTIWLFYSPSQNRQNVVETKQQPCGCASCNGSKDCESGSEQVYNMIGAGDVESDVLLEGYDNIESYANIESDIESFDGSEQYEDSIEGYDNVGYENVGSVYEDQDFMPQLTNRKEALTGTDYDSFRIMDHTDYTRGKQQKKQNIDNINNMDADKTDNTKPTEHPDRMSEREYLSREEYNSMINMRPHMETYNDIDESAGEYVDLDGSAEQTMDFANLSTTINKYRNAAIRDIRNGGEHDGSIDREFKFYDGI